jgi:hypothetical protein
MACEHVSDTLRLRLGAPRRGLMQDKPVVVSVDMSIRIDGQRQSKGRGDDINLCFQGTPACHSGCPCHHHHHVCVRLLSIEGILQEPPPQLHGIDLFGPPARSPSRPESDGPIGLFLIGSLRYANFTFPGD